MDFACRWSWRGILGDEKFAWICGGHRCRVCAVGWEATCPGCLRTGDMARWDSTWMGAHGGDCAACDAPIGSCTLGDCNWICSSCKCLETLLPPCCASFSNLCNTSADRSSSHLGKGGEQAPDPPERPSLTSLLYSTATLEPFSSKWLDSCDRLRSLSDAGSYFFWQQVHVPSFNVKPLQSGTSSIDYTLISLIAFDTLYTISTDSEMLTTWIMSLVRAKQDCCYSYMGVSGNHGKTQKNTKHPSIWYLYHHTVPFENI